MPVLLLAYRQVGRLMPRQRCKKGSDLDAIRGGEVQRPQERPDKVMFLGLDVIKTPDFSAVRGFYHSGFVGEDDRLRTVVEVEFGVDTPNVGLHRTLTQN